MLLVSQRESNQLYFVLFQGKQAAKPWFSSQVSSWPMVGEGRWLLKAETETCRARLDVGGAQKEPSTECCSLSSLRAKGAPVRLSETLPPDRCMKNIDFILKVLWGNKTSVSSSKFGLFSILCQEILNQVPLVSFLACIFGLCCQIN